MNASFQKSAVTAGLGRAVRRCLTGFCLAGLLGGSALAATAAAPDEAGVAAQAMRVQKAEALLVQVRKSSAALVQLLVAPDRETRVPLYQQIDAANAESAKLLASLAGETRPAATQAPLAELAALREGYEVAYTSSVEEIELNGAQGALAQFWSATREAQGKLEGGVTRLLGAERALLEEQQSALASARRASETSTLILAAVAGVAALSGAFFVFRNRRRKAV